MKRRPTKDQRIAAALLHIPGLVPSELRDRSAQDILKEFEWHHWPIPFADGGTCEPQNLTPMLRADHVRETRTKTIPTLSKNKRLRVAHKEHRERLAAKAGVLVQEMASEPEWLAPSRSSKVKRKMQGRGFQGSRKFNGQVTFKKASRRHGG